MKTEGLKAQPAGERSRQFKPWKGFSSPWFFIGLFAVLGLIGTLNHVMWRDEFNTWLIVRDSDSLLEMLGRVKYQGHTALWSLCVSLLQNFSDSPVIMQVFHWALAVLSVTVFWLYSPFSHRQKALFTFGYIPFYQYLLIARPYALGMLFLFMFCAVFPARKKSYIPAAILLALMANSNAYALFIAAALLAMLGLEFLLNEEQRSRYLSHASSYDLVISAIIVAASFGFSAYILTPPIDSTNHGGLHAWKLALDVRRALKAWNRIFGGYTLIVPDSSRWPDLILCSLLTLGAIAIFLLKFLKKPLVFGFFVLAYLQFLGFSYFRYLGGGPRHFGHLYLILLAAFWIGSYLPESDALTKRLSVSRRWLAIGQNWASPLLTTIIVFQFLGGLYGLPRDLFIPFSASRQVTTFIQDSGWQDEFIVASRDANMAPISGYLDRQLYYPELREMGSFTLYREERREVSHAEILDQIQDLITIQKRADRVLLLLHKPLDAESETLSIEPIREFTRAWIDTEHYYLYWVTV